MAYFPFFTQLEGQSGLIVGGGAVALRKARSLLPYGPRLTVTAPEICEELRQLPGVELRQRGFRPEDLEGMDFLIAASDDRQVNALAARLCRERRIPVNAADSREDSSFLFPSLVKRGELSIGISTGGASPAAARYLRQEIERLLPEQLEELLEDLDRRRDWVRERVPEQEIRSKLLRALFAAGLEAGRPLTDGETEELLEKIRKGEEP